MKHTEFEETPMMPTYLLGLLISDFVCKNATANAAFTQKISVRVCGRPNAQNYFDFALKTSVTIMEFYNRFFGMEYLLPKCGKMFYN